MSLIRLLFPFTVLLQQTFCLMQEYGRRARHILMQKMSVWEEEHDQQGQMGATMPI